MRGDSIRDRYAKGLALLGLGMLAGAGAIVDHWPGTARLLLVPPAERPWLATAALPSRDPLAIVVPLPSAPHSVRVAPAPRPVPVLRVSQTALAFGAPVTLIAPPPVPAPVIPPPADAVAVLASADLGATTTVNASLILPPLAAPRQGAAWAAEAAEGEDDGFLPHAVKHAGASILRGSARAGTSVYDVVRSLGGTLRRALPN